MLSCHMSLMPALERQGLADLSEFMARVAYRVNSRTPKAAQTSPVSKNQTKLVIMWGWSDS